MIKLKSSVYPKDWTPEPTTVQFNNWLSYLSNLLTKYQKVYKLQTYV